MLPEERLLVEPLVERWVWLPELRCVWAIAPRLDRLVWTLAVRLCDAELEERLALTEEDPRLVVCEEDDREVVADPPARRDWAEAPGAANIANTMVRAATVLIILLIVLSFLKLAI